MAKLTPKLEKWFDIPEENGPGRVLISHLKDGEIDRIQADATNYWGDAGREFKAGTALDNITVAAVKGWENFNDEEGNPLPCIPFNIRRYLAETWFRDFVTAKRQELRELVQPKIEEAEKN